MLFRSLSSKSKRSKGFSLIEVLLVLAIIGIISGIAIPSYLGQRRRARVIGDAMANAKVLAMQLETYKADNGNYGTASTSATWTSGSTTVPTAYSGLSFVAKGNSKMDYTLNIGTTGLTYTIDVTETATSTTYLRIDHTGAELYRYQ